jgi:hypothetical protein
VRRVVVLVVAVTMLFVACGDGAPSLSTEERALADALVAEFESDPDTPFSADDGARCFADRFVGEFGVARLAEIGVTVESIDNEPDFGALSTEEIDRLADIAMGCVDFKGAFAIEMAAEGISEDSARCLADGLHAEGFFRATLISGLTGQDIPNEDAMMASFVGWATRCLTAAELSEFMGGD